MMEEVEKQIKLKDEQGNDVIANEIVLDWRSLKSKRQKRRKFKDYQEQLLKEIPGAATRTNVAMHAVIDTTAEGNENHNQGMGTTAEIRNQALIHYIARLANSNRDGDEFDFSFVESLLENGADINAADRYGQTMFHEVSRSWNVDVARFLLNRGANINQQDRYGRAPLHVAAAVNYTEMIEFLLKHEADIGITTFGELQTPIHFAAKNDACQALKLLINYGASIHIRDYQNRTPLQVAASMSRSKAARYLVELGAPTGVYDNNGEMALSLLILKMPEVAILALDQFRSQDMINRKEYYFLNYVEGPRVFEKDPRENKARSPLEVAIQHEHYGIVMHPVMQRLINMKWENFGKKAARKDLIINVIFAFVWTILGITMPMHADQLYSPMHDKWWRFVTALIGICLTCLEVYKQVSSLIYMNKAVRRWKLFRENALKNDQRFCHPQWRDENEYLEKEIKIAREERLLTRQDSWIILDWTALLFILSGLASHIVFLVVGSTISRDVHVRIVCFLLIIMWIRLLKFTRPFKSPGPFVASMAPMLKDFLKWSLLFCLLFIPYAAIFWMIFGPLNSKPASSFKDIPGVLFSVFTMAAFSSLQSIDELSDIDSNMARILISSCVAISTVITLNLLIAMLADTFTRMYEKSLEAATMQRAKTILYLEQMVTTKTWCGYCKHIQHECSPEVTTLCEEMSIGKRDKMRMKENLHRCVNEVHALVSDRFAQRIGDEKSDIDRLLQGVNSINENISSVMRQLPSHHGTSLLGNTGVVNLHIVLEQPGAGTTSIVFNNSTKSDKTMHSNHTQFSEAEIKREKTESTLREQRDMKGVSEYSSDSLVPSDHAPERDHDVNKIIAQKLSDILHLMKDAMKKGKLNVKTHEGTHISEEQQNNDVADQLHCAAEQTTEKSDDDQTFAKVTEDWALYETTAESSDEIHETTNPGYLWDDMGSSVSQPTTSGDMWKGSSMETSDGIVGSNDSQPQSPTDRSRPRIASLMNARRRVRNEGSSFLSTTSSEGDITGDDFVHNKNVSRRNLDLNIDGVRKRTQLKEIPNKSLKQQYLNKKILFTSASSSNSSQTDDSNRRISDDLLCQKLDDVTEHESRYDDDISSSRATDVSSDHLSDSALLIQDRDGSSQESIGVGTPWEARKQIVSNVPRVKWADTAQNNTGTPFLNIREISQSTSECSSLNLAERDIGNWEEEKRLQEE